MQWFICHKKPIRIADATVYFGQKICFWLRYMDIYIWTPEEESGPKIKLSVIVHCGIDGSMKGGFIGLNWFWKNGFGGVRWRKMHPILFGSVYIASWPNQILNREAIRTVVALKKPRKLLHFDLIYIIISKNGYKCILVLLEDLSSFVWIFTVRTSDAETALSRFETTDLEDSEIDKKY